MQLSQFKQSPVLVRVVPFAIFLVLTFCQNYFGDTGRYWFYFAKTVVAAWLIWSVRPFIAEMKWQISLEAIVVGVAVFVMWVGLSSFLAALGINPSFSEMKLSGKGWNPVQTFGDGSGLAWFFIIIRILGATLVVPPLEEVFFRSFLYRYIANPDFQTVSLARFFLLPFLVTSTLFGFEHREWLAGILCGFAYQALAIHKKRLGDAISAHALTNLLLGLWVVWKGAWNFW
jgi:CAAX prenyl protease-like protein